MKRCAGQAAVIEKHQLYVWSDSCTTVLFVSKTPHGLLSPSVTDIDITVRNEEKQMTANVCKFKHENFWPLHSHSDSSSWNPVTHQNSCDTRSWFSTTHVGNICIFARFESYVYLLTLWALPGSWVRGKPW